MCKELSPPLWGSPAAAVGVGLVRCDETQVVVYNTIKLVTNSAVKLDKVERSL